MADIYLDSASAMPLSPAARDAMLASLDVFGDPLHIHGPGREARRILDTSRSTVAEAIGAQPDELVFTSADVLGRAAEHGDLFAPVETLEQELPAL